MLEVFPGLEDVIARGSPAQSARQRKWRRGRPCGPTVRSRGRQGRGCPAKCPTRSRPLWPPSFPGWGQGPSGHLFVVSARPAGWTGLFPAPPEVGFVTTPGPRGQRSICGQEVPRDKLISCQPLLPEPCANGGAAPLRHGQVKFGEPRVPGRSSACPKDCLGQNLSCLGCLWVSLDPCPTVTDSAKLTASPLGDSTSEPRVRSISARPLVGVGGGAVL